MQNPHRNVQYTVRQSPTTDEQRRCPVLQAWCLQGWRYLALPRIAEVNCTVAEWGDAGDVRILCEGCRKPFQPAFRHNHIRIEKHKTGRTHMTDGNVDGLHKAEIRLVAQE